MRRQGPGTMRKGGTVLTGTHMGTGDRDRAEERTYIPYTMHTNTQ